MHMVLSKNSQLRRPADVSADIVKRLQMGATLRQIAEELHIHRTTIHRKMEDWYGEEEWDAMLSKLRKKGKFQSGNSVGIETRFQKGHKHGIASRWPKNNLRGRAAKNWRPIGSIMLKMIRKGKRRIPVRFIKVIDEANKYGWIRYARWLWQQHYGPVPPGMVVCCLDGNMSNDDNLDNLEVMKRVDYVRYLESRFPVRLEQRKLRNSRALKKHWQHNDKRKAQKLWECSSCGADYHVAIPETCEKCGACSFERIERKE
jgi:hypothetical protein